MDMNYVCTSMIIASTLALSACNKTNKVDGATATTTAQPTEMDVQVDIDGEEMTIVVNGEEFEGLPEDMMAHVMQMIANGEDADVEVDVSYGWTGQAPDGMMQGGSRMLLINTDEMPEGIEQHIVGMMMGGEHGDMRIHGEHGQHDGGRRMHDRDIPAEIQFMEELGILDEVADYLEENDAVALMGIHMIREALEGDLRMEALNTIIEASSEGSATRNAAIIVAIQTLQEDGNDEGAAELMVELVLSN